MSSWSISSGIVGEFSVGKSRLLNTLLELNGLLPVRVATDRVRQLDALRGDPDEVRARISQQIPLRRYGEPEEFGRVAAFLLSPAASFVTGAVLVADGGQSIVDLGLLPLDPDAGIR